MTHLDWDGQSWVARPVLEGVSATCVATDGERVLVGTRGDGARLSSDGGGSWEPIDLPERDVFSVAISGADGALYAGTEPSRLFVARDGGPWQELAALQDIPSRERWSFPPRRVTDEEVETIAVSFARCPGAPYCGHLARLVAFGRRIRGRTAAAKPAGGA